MVHWLAASHKNLKIGGGGREGSESSSRSFWSDFVRFIPASYPSFTLTSNAGSYSFDELFKSGIREKETLKVRFIFTLYIYTVIYWIHALEKTVQALMKERREKVEEVKKKTNYYSTRDLIQRYDEASPATPPQLRVNPGQSLPVTPQQQQPFPNNLNSNGRTLHPALNPALQAQLSRGSILLSFISD